MNIQSVKPLQSVGIERKQLEKLFEENFVFPDKVSEKLQFKKLLTQISRTYVGAQLLKGLNKNNKILLELGETDDCAGYNQSGKITLSPSSGASTLLHELEHERQAQKKAVGLPISYEDKVLNVVLCEASARIAAAAFCAETNTDSLYPVDRMRINYFKKIFEEKYPDNKALQWEMAQQSAIVCAILTIKNPEKLEDFNQQLLEETATNNLDINSIALLRQKDCIAQDDEEWGDSYLDKQENEEKKKEYTDVENFCQHLDEYMKFSCWGRFTDFKINDNFTPYYDISKAVEILIADKLLPATAIELLKNAVREQKKLKVPLERILTSYGLSQNCPEYLFNLPDNFSERIETKGNQTKLYVNDMLKVVKIKERNKNLTFFYNQNNKCYCRIEETKAGKKLSTPSDFKNIVFSYDVNNRLCAIELKIDSAHFERKEFFYNEKGGGMVRKIREAVRFKTVEEEYYNKQEQLEKKQEIKHYFTEKGEWVQLVQYDDKLRVKVYASRSSDFADKCEIVDAMGKKSTLILQNGKMVKINRQGKKISPTENDKEIFDVLQNALKESNFSKKTTSVDIAVAKMRQRHRK